MPGWVARPRGLIVCNAPVNGRRSPRVDIPGRVANYLLSLIAGGTLFSKLVLVEIQAFEPLDSALREAGEIHTSFVIFVVPPHRTDDA